MHLRVVSLVDAQAAFHACWPPKPGVELAAHFFLEVAAARGARRRHDRIGRRRAQRHRERAAIAGLVEAAGVAHQAQHEIAARERARRRVGRRIVGRRSHEGREHRRFVTPVRALPKYPATPLRFRSTLREYNRVDYAVRSFPSNTFLEPQAIVARDVAPNVPLRVGASGGRALRDRAAPVAMRPAQFGGRLRCGEGVEPREDKRFLDGEAGRHHVRDTESSVNSSDFDKEGKAVFCCCS